MPVEELLIVATEIMFIGMSTVFVILGLLITCMSMLSKLAPEDREEVPCRDDKSIIAAIQTAIHVYRSRTATQ